jgi:hypothetical protein
MSETKRPFEEMTAASPSPKATIPSQRPPALEARGAGMSVAGWMGALLDQLDDADLPRS